MQAEKQSEQNDWKVEYPSIGAVFNCVLNIDEGKVRENIAHALTLGLPEIWPHKQQDTEVCICAGGPSLADHIEEIREKQQNGAKVIALANVAHLLLAHDIRPNAHILLDAKPRNAEFVTNCDTTFFISSQCDPKVFENAKKTGNDIYLYHAVNNEEEFQVIKDHYQAKTDISGDVNDSMWIPVQGGSTITMRTLRLFTLLGYSKFHMYGWDSCLREGKHHAYEQPDADKQKVLKFEFEDRLFHVTSWMIAQVMEMQTFIKQFCMNIDMAVHGDGLIAYIIEQSTHLKVDIKEE